MEMDILLKVMLIAIASMIVFGLIYFFLAWRDYKKYCYSVKKILEVVYRKTYTYNDISKRTITKYNWDHGRKPDAAAQEIAANGGFYRRSVDI